MTMHNARQRLQDFDVQNASLSLWTFKKKAGAELEFSAKSVLVTHNLGDALKQAALSLKERAVEVEEYTLLTQCTETGVLAMQTNGTAFAKLKRIVDLPAEENLVTNAKQIENSVGYLVRLRSRDDVIYFFKKTENSWRSKTARSVINVLLNVNQLDVVDDRTFTIAKNFDFVVIDDHILVANKSSFETIFNFKSLYQDSFTTLQRDASFSGIFSTMDLLIQHVGTNTMHLRRMEVIRQKQLYTDAAFIERLRQVNARKGWNISFDERGRIVPTEESIKAILQVLLNHRLYSELTLGDFDVPSAVRVA